MFSRYFFIFFIACSLFSCFSNSTDNPDLPVVEEPNPSPPLIYLALGDSYTIGESVPANERYPVQLKDSLLPYGIAIDEVNIIAKTGWTTDELQAGIDAANIQNDTFGLVSLLIGVNNQYRNRPVSTYEPEFTSLLNQAIDFAGGRKDRVFVVSIPDYAFTPFGQGKVTISNGIDAYNAANKAIAEQMGIRYFNITPLSRKGLDQPDLVAPDGLHPSGKQYAEWVSLMLPGVMEMLD